MNSSEMRNQASKTNELRVASSQHEHAAESALNSGMGHHLSNKYGAINKDQISSQLSKPEEMNKLSSPGLGGNSFAKLNTPSYG